VNSSVTAPGKQLAKIEFDRAFAAARLYALKSRAKSTWRAYRSDWQQFEAWCQTVCLQPLPAEPETISMFVASQAADGLNPSTITRRLSAIRLVHLGAGHPSPHNTIKVIEVMRGIRRDWARPPERKAPAIVQEIKEMVDAMDKEMAKGLRDRALLLIGFAGAFRRSELVALNTWNLEYRDEGVKVTIQISKTDQESKGQVIAIVRQPVCGEFQLFRINAYKIQVLSC
jgi:site-specific recombinase XerD